MKVGKTGLRLHTGKVIQFKSKAARDKYERYNQALKHGWKPTKGRSKGVGATKKAKASKIEP
jgi:hypothetical protein